MRQIPALFIAVAASSLLTASGLAHVDLAGGWGQRFHEDLPERGAGPDIGDYLGLPINDAARLRADSWDAGKWTMLERQCEPHPADYAPRGPAKHADHEHGGSDLSGSRSSAGVTRSRITFPERIAISRSSPPSTDYRRRRRAA